MPEPATLRWPGGEIEIEHDLDAGCAVIHARSYAVSEDRAGILTRAGLSDNVSYTLSAEEARALFNWLGKYLHGA